MLQFFVNKGLVATGMIVKFGAAYWLLSVPAFILQIITIVLVFRLQKQHFGRHGSGNVTVTAS